MSNECGIKVKILNKFLFLFSHISCMFLLLSLSPWKLSEAHIYSGYAVKFALLPPYCLVCCCCIPHPPSVDRDRLDSFCCQKEQHTAHKIISHKVQSTHESAEPKTPSRTTKQRRKCDDESSSSFLSPYIFLVNLSQSVDCSNRCFWSAQHTKNGDGNSRNKRKTQIKIALQPPLSPCHMFRPREKKNTQNKKAIETECLANSRRRRCRNIFISPSTCIYVQSHSLIPFLYRRQSWHAAAARRA